MDTNTNGTDCLLTEDQMNVVAYINIVTSSLSALGAGSVIICSIYHRKICFPEVYPIFHLSIADLLASVFFLSSTILFLKDTANFPGSSGPCDYVTAVMTSFYISTLFLTLAYALEAYLRVRKRLVSGPETLSRDTQRKVVSYSSMHLVYATCWILPLVCGVILLVFTHFVPRADNRKKPDLSGQGIDIIPQQCSTCLPVFHYSQDQPCWSYVEHGPSWHLAYKLVFLLPLIIVFLVNICFYVCIIRAFKQVSARRGLYGYHQHQEETTVKRKAVLYQSAFFCCWLPTLILGFISFTPTFEMRTYFWLYTIQPIRIFSFWKFNFCLGALLGPLQGFLNCIIYGWRRQSFRRALSETSSLTSTNMPSYLSLTL